MGESAVPLSLVLALGVVVLLLADPVVQVPGDSYVGICVEQGPDGSRAFGPPTRYRVPDGWCLPGSPEGRGASWLWLPGSRSVTVPPVGGVVADVVIGFPVVPSDTVKTSGFPEEGGATGG